MVDPGALAPPTETIPPHLAIHLAEQHYDRYTAIDQACWRFIMRVSKSFFARHAHGVYVDGLSETGISVERIPRIAEMDRKLRRFGWRAVPVCGFIPPAAFLECQAYGLLPIACDMRKLANVGYTPAPDIVHEAAGHAPILADPGFANYLRGYGEVARRAVLSQHNQRVYEAIRRLSDLKEDPGADDDEVAAAEQTVCERQGEIAADSEVDWVSRLGWWTAEYGLIGDLEQPRIYGAGLLSSISESYRCLGSSVRKLPLTAECIEQDFDITRPQPQLYVTPDFAHLQSVLDEVAARMCFRQGPDEALAILRRSGCVNTVLFDNGLQVSGVFEAEQEAGLLHCSGACQLAIADQELPDCGPEQLRDGLVLPLGPLAASTPRDLRVGSRCDLQWASGVSASGRVERLHRDGSRLLSVALGDARLCRSDRLLSSGVLHLPYGAAITGGFGGAADRWAYLCGTGGDSADPGEHDGNAGQADSALEHCYARVRAVREHGGADAAASREVVAVANEVDAIAPDDWLLRMELLELVQQWGLAEPDAEALEAHLLRLRATSGSVAEHIDRGLAMLGRASDPALD